MKEIELIGKRKAREKHFLKENGIITANVYDEDIHFLKDGKYEEIDNTLVEENGYLVNKNNAYKVYFSKKSKDELMEMSIGNNYIKTRLVYQKEIDIKENITQSKLHKNVCYPDIIDNVDLEYNVMPGKVKEAIILKNKNVDLEKLVFLIETNTKLELKDNKKITSTIDNNNCFEFDAPYMVDANFKTNNNINYKLTKIDDGIYQLELIIDKEWLNNEETTYPVMIDPTITNSGQNNSVYDTYIYPGDTGINRNSEDKLKVGVERVNGTDRINRALLKFDLPTIGTGSQVINAYIDLYGYPEYPYNYHTDILTIHQITEDWNEADADWNNMNDKYNSLVEGMLEASRGYYDLDNETIQPAYCSANITRLVRKWYTGTSNYGLMLKLNDEKYNPNVLPTFYSKNNDIEGGNPKPLLYVTYRNQNGILNYMDYQVQDFSKGSAYVNSYNGNLTTRFNIGSTMSGKLPVSLEMIYNTNDVVLKNDLGYGLGYKFSLHQTIKEVIIENKTYLEYNDEDGTLHYFLNQKTSFDESGYNTENTESVYYDEDGLNMTITKNDNDYILKDSYGNTMKFIKNGDIAFLREIEDVEGNKNIISYDSSDKITKIIDANNEEINITYAENAITIFSPNETVTLNYSDNKLINIIHLVGTTQFEYNDKNLLSKIIDINGLKISYDYYNQIPYKVKKVCEYGTENNLGNYYELIYGYDSTTIIDSNDKARTIIFNSQGSIVSVSSLRNKDDIENAYGISQINGTNQNTINNGSTNKLLRTEIPLKYVKNLLTNTSFEKNQIDFNCTNDVNLSISTENSSTGINSLKAISTSENQILSQDISVTKGEYYTFSAFVKNTNKVKLALSYLDENNVTIESESETIDPSDDFERYDVTIEYPETATSNLILKIYLNNVGTTYVDDVQLETGEVANNYNLLENSDFSKGLLDWKMDVVNSITYEESPTNDYFKVVDINDKIKALQIKINPAYNCSIEKTFNIEGKAGDVFNISFWYKNKGIDSNLSMNYGSRVYVSFNYINQDDGHCGIPSPILNPNDQSWQYVSNDFVAEKDYNSITVIFSREYDANDLYITNINLFKDIRNVYYQYDENGNIISENGLDNKNIDCNYDRNSSLIKITEPSGDYDMFEYDNVVTNRLINGISDFGISNQRKYDLNGNAITTRIIKNNIHGEVTAGVYRIRLKGSYNYLKNISNTLKISEKDGYGDLWVLEKYEEYFKIRHSIVINKYFTVQENNLLLSSYNNEFSLFELIKNENGSYLIKSKVNDKYIKINDDSTFNMSNYEEGDYHFEFYFETIDSNLFIETNTTYDDNGKYIKSTTNSLLNKILYDTDETTGLLKSVTASNGVITNYNYNVKNQISSITSKNMSVNYDYDGTKLSQITFGSKQYKFSYDTFLNLKTIKIGDKINLITNDYGENNGNLVASNFGNNQIVSYEYDEFDRISKIIRMDDTFNYKYNSNGDLVKVISDNTIINSIYDNSKRLSEYKFNNFKVKYSYDSRNNVINTKYILNETNSIENEFDSDNLITKIKFNDSQVNYNYDSLGRVINSNINSIFNTNYKYLTNGKRTSYIISQLNVGNEIFSYKYDKMENITHVYKNGILQNRYYYNDYNELIKEKDYLNNELKKYDYDNVGNILSKKVYELNSFSLLRKDKFEYNNVDWEDQLTKFNNDIIIYDNVGNPVAIGNKIELNWINGRELHSLINEDKLINYLYDHNGIRIGKIVNNIKTDYYIEGSDVIYEKTNDNILYYIRDNTKGLIGFKYNNELYYYVKNNLDDVIGILDNSYKMVAKYEYDSWGNILSISDENGNDISNNDNHIANINPYRYRSYYYDKETKLYYLNQRYYNPLWGRFLNADTLLGANKDLISYNLYTYCSNNPISNCDISGRGIGSLFKAIKKVVKKVVKKVKQVVKKVVSVVKTAVKVVKIGATIVKEQTSKKPKEEAFCPKQVVNPKINSYPDYTSELNRILAVNTAKALTIKKVNPLGSMDYFYQNEKETNAAWDYKSQEPWENDINVPYLGVDGPFIFNGYVITAEDFGNIHYGFVGYMLGFTPEVLYTGGGYQNSGLSVDIVKGPYYGDNRNDFCYVKYGIELAKKKK